MTATDERIDRLEIRVEKIEDKISVNLQRIFEALEELRLTGAKTACPNPGACVTLSAELQHAITAHNATMLRVERLEIKMLDTERLAIAEARKTDAQFHKIDNQKAWVLGAWSVVAFLAAIIGAAVPVAIKYLGK